MKKMYVIFVFLILAFCLSAYQADVKFTDNWDKQGLSIEEQSNQNLKLNYSITQFYFKDVSINSENMINIHLPGVFLPNDEGMPNLPGNSRYIAIPQGAKAELNIIDYRIEKYSDIEVAPAPRIPLDTEDGPLVYNKNNEIYSRNANYPENFIQLSEPSKLRGIDVVMLGITPFQYNPVSKELIVYRDIKFEVNFSGGNGHFGEDRLRNRWWDPIIKDAILNQSILSDIDYNSRELSRDGAEYLIICPDDPDFLAWADSIKVFRQEQGISTMIRTTTEVGGNTVSAIETFVDNAYNSWSTPPAAVLLLGDYGTETSGIVSEWYTHPAGYPDFVSDNKFADVAPEDNLPDIVFARITANDASQLEVMITKFLNYERNPPTDTDFYHHPITALGWQTERWFQICSEVVGGYFREVLGKDPVRINAIYSGTPGTVWSTATNTSDVVDYFGPSRGLGYIPATPAELGGWSGGTGADVINAINNGSFMLQHRDHGNYSGWGEPAFNSTSINSLTNINNKLPFIFSINCQTGAFHRVSETFAEKFHRHTYNGQNSGALGILAATEVSYSFVNDTFVWGVMDNMFPNFMPSETTEFPNNFVMPAFGNAAGKHFLYGSSWPYNYNDKLITYRLFHHHGDAFLNVYTEVPQNLIVSHSPTLLAGATTFNVTADDGSFIALTVDGEIIGTADGTGSSASISIPAQFPPFQILVTVTKQNYFRYSELVEVVSSNQAYVIYNDHLINDPTGNNDGAADYGEDITLDMTLKNVGDRDAISVNAILSTLDSYMTIIDDTQSFGSISQSSTSTEPNAFAFTIAGNIPDQHIINFDIEVTGNSARETWNSTFQITVNAPELMIDDMIIDDSIEITNGRLDPGETVDLIIPTNNIGHSNSPSAIGTISCTNEFITINGSDTYDFGVIDAGSTENAVFNITVDPYAPIGTQVSFDYNITVDSYGVNETFNRMIGLVVEDFETNNFAFYPWEFGGDAAWSVVSEDPHEGLYCAKSDEITHNQTSELIITGEVTADGTISFYRKVSSESTYDFLKFYIDGAQQETWSGEVAWGEVSYPVTTGNRTFKWEYFKDGSVDTSSDCAWVDWIIFPAIYFPEPADITVAPSSFEETLLPGGSNSDILTIGNAGEITLEYTASVSYVERNITTCTSGFNGMKSETENIISTDKRSSSPQFIRDRDYATIGAGASTSTGTGDTPFGTFYHDGQNQYLFTASELSTAGLIAGDVNAVGWNIASSAAQTMNGFNIEIKHTSATSVTGFETGFTNCYSGTWTASAGWNDITLSTPFNWDGASNLLVKICFDNTSYTSNSSCYIDTYTAMNGWAYNDSTSGCSDPYEGTIDSRPQIRFDYTAGPTLSWLTLNGGSSVTGSIDSDSSDDVLSVLFDTVPDGLTEGTYEANITITSNDPDQPTITVHVTLSISQQLDVPQNVTITTTPNGADVDVLISWTAVPGATSYTVYRSYNPYAEFPSQWTSVTGITGTTWSYTTDRMHRFYRVTANN